MTLEVSISGPQLEVVQDLLAALSADDLTDVSLVGHDGLAVPACRFVLAARSRVLKRMLYGNFREAKLTTTPLKIELLDYSSQVLKVVVRFCCRGQCFAADDDDDKFLLTQQQKDTAAKEEFLRLLVNVAKAADYLEIPSLVRETEGQVKQLISKHPLLACPVFDEADEGSALFASARRVIQCRPYMALLSSPPTHGSMGSECGGGGGVECLGSDRVVALMKDTEMEAGELFLFEMLKRWVHHVPEAYQKEALAVARECGTSFLLHYIEPDQLLSTVQKSGLFPPNLIVEAIMRQALKASQSRVWTINCRGKDANVDRVLVEGSGNQQVNGLYYRIAGLHNGDVYSKREVSCGQLYVYTLSCSGRKTIESRIFCSKVMTHRAVPTILAQRQVAAPTPVVVFQPLLQVISLEAPHKRGNPDTSPLAKLCKIELSDGDHFVTGTLAQELSGMVEDNLVVENSLIKVLAFDLYEFEGKQKVHVLDVSFVGAHPGHRLGNPVEIMPTKDDNTSSPPSASPPVAVAAAARNSQHKISVDNGLQKLYSCYYPMDQQAKDSKIPRTGWHIEEDGVAPAPRCTWIPATVRRFGDISQSNSQEEEEEDRRQRE